MRLNVLKSYLGSLLLCLLLSTTFAYAQQSPAAQVREAFAPYDRDDGPGAIVAVARGGEVVYAEAFGQANLTHGVPLSVGTRSNIGSTSKQFTAYALLKLEEEGRLSLDDDVREYLPSLPDFGETVTLRHLLTHTSGYREYLNTLLLEGRQLLRGDVVDIREIVPLVQRQPELQNAPGAEWNYNNTGYALAAMVVERVTGLSFAAWMRVNVFEPNGMDSTLIRISPGEVIRSSAQGYVPNAAGRYAEVPDLGASRGAGGMYTTAQDLARWMRVYAGRGPLVEAMTNEYVTTSGDSTRYGLGLFLDEERGQERWQHGGSDTAHRTAFAYYPNLDAGYLILTNDAAFDMTLADDVANAFFGEHFDPLPPEGAMPTEPLAGYDVAEFDGLAGRYALDVMPTFVLTFFREEDALYTQATGQQRVPIVPTSDSTFKLTLVDADVVFHRDASGEATSLTLHQNGQNRATRLPEEDDETAPIAVDDFAGHYYSEELGTTYVVTLGEEEGTLTLSQRRFGEVTLTHDEGDEFTGTLPVMTARFERGEGGEVNALVVGNGRARDIRLDRVR